MSTHPLDTVIHKDTFSIITCAYVNICTYTVGKVPTYMYSSILRFMYINKSCMYMFL